MTEAATNPLHSAMGLKIKALELANQHPETAGKLPDAVVNRATAYHAYLAGTTAAAPAKPAAAVTTTGKPAAAAAGAAAKPAAAATAGAAAPKTTPKPAQKPAAAAAGAAQNNPSPDTKDPKGKFTFKDVCDSLGKVMKAKGRDAAMAILTNTGKADHTRNVKPANYDAVVAACSAALAPATQPAAPADDPLGDPPETTGGGIDAESDPTAGPATDELGLPA